MSDNSVPTYHVLGARINPLTISDLHRVIQGHVTRRESCVIASRNLHGVYVARRDEPMQEFYRGADYVRIDGMPIALWARILGYPVRREHRVTWVDWLRPLLRESAAKGWRVFYLGSEPGIAEKGAEVISNEIPEVQIATEGGFFDMARGSVENERVVQRIRSFGPDILLVGMGMPRQERWILENRASLPPMVVLPCGACMDYVAGYNRTPPRWMGRWGFEWLGRFLSDPRRLWRRYFIEPWFLADLFVKDAIATLAGRRRKAEGRLFRPD